MFESNISKFLLLPLLGVALASMLLLLPYNNIQFVIFACFPLIMVGGAVLTKRKLLLDVKLIDVFWAGFALLGFSSYFWATNPALVWYRGFCFLGLFLISIIFRDLIKYPSIRKYFPILMSILFLIIFVQHLMAVHFDLTFLDSSWNQFLNRNSNVTTCYLVTLFPFLLFKQSKNQFYRFVKILSAILILNILFLANVKIVILSLLMIMLYYFWSNQRKLLFVLFAMAVFGIIIVNGFFSYDEIMAKHFASIYKPDNFSRLDLANLSIVLFKNNPILGVGNGNWITEVYSQDLNNISLFRNADDFSRLHSHNLYLKVAGELGVVGLLLFIAPFVMTLYRGFVRVKQLDYVEKASFASVVSYLFVSSYYGGVNLYEYNFSGVEVLAFISMGILSARLFSNRSRLNYLVTIPLTVLTIFWFVYSAISWHNIHMVLNHKKEMTLQDRISTLSSTYNGSFLTTYGFDRPLDLDIAELHDADNDIDSAIERYEMMLDIAPYNCNGLLSYSKFLIDKNLDLDKAKILLTKANEIQSDPKIDQLLQQLNNK